MYQQAQVCYESGDYSGMLAYNLQALQQVESSSCHEKALAYLRVGRAYYFLQQRQSAIQNFQAAVQIATHCSDSLKTTAYRFLGSVYCELQNSDSASYYLLKAEKTLLAAANWRELSTLYAVMGEAFSDKRKAYFELAEKYALKANDTTNMAFAALKLGVLALEQKDCKKSEQYLQKALILYRSVKQTDGEMYALRMIANTQAHCNKTGEAYLNALRYADLHDSIFRNKTAVATAHLRTLYETEKKEKENLELIKNRRLILLSSVVVLLLLIAAFIFIHYSNKLRQQKEWDEKLAEQQRIRFAAVVEAEENERKRIAGDLHDGIGQMMSAAKINLSLLQSELPFTNEEQQHNFEKTVALIDESCKEVRNVSHNMMPNVLLKSGLARAIQNFINKIDSRVLRVEFFSEGLDAPLPTNKEVILYRIIQECVNNVIKHAHASKLFIALIKDEHEISITVEDNGVGFDRAVIKNADGIGLKNIQSRINYLNGNVEWDTVIGKGTVVTIQIPA